MTTIIKFGGSSIKNSIMIKKVSDIITGYISNNSKIIIIFSAFDKTTENLLKCVSLASNSNQKYLDIYQKIFDTYTTIVKELFVKNSLNLEEREENRICLMILKELRNLKDILKGIYLIHENYKKTLDCVLSYGEEMTSKIMYEYLKHKLKKNTKYLDSRDVIKTNNNYLNADVNLSKSTKLIKEYLSKNDFELLIVPGFIASCEEDNSTTTIGRGGSDYTASIYAVGCDANSVIIWTDVNGILTSDPKIIHKTKEIKEMTYNEMFELSYYGGKVLYHKTISPLYENNIPLFIKNTYNPTHPGTKISNDIYKKNVSVSAISCLKHISLIRMNGSLLQGNVGIASRIFTCLSSKNVNMIIISQSSSEIAINIGINRFQADIARETIFIEFEKEMKKGLINFDIKNNVSVIAAISSHESNKCKTLEKLLKIVNENKIHTYMHNSSGLNSCVIIDEGELNRNMNIIHNNFFETNGYKYNIFILGLGNIGSGLFSLINKRIQNDINIVSVANSKKVLTDYSLEKKNLNEIKTLLNNSETQMNIETYTNDLINSSLSNKILIDCTSNSIIPTYYDKILNNNISIVTPNKKSMSEDLSQFKNLLKFNNKNKFKFETTVSAGLPIIKILYDLVKCNHKIFKIEGMFSGTLNYVLSSFIKNENESFSDIIRNAWKNGITEPNPYDDLSGIDVARKLLILIRICGLNINLEDININGLINFVAPTTEDFFNQIENCDNHYHNLKMEANRERKKLKYIATYIPDTNEMNVKLCQIYKDHPFYSIDGTNNVTAITTNIYTEPIIIRGFGAGTYQTASGILADLLEI